MKIEITWVMNLKLVESGKKCLLLDGKLANLELDFFCSFLASIQNPELYPES